MLISITKNKRVLNDLFYAFSAQGISLLLSITMSLLVPKLLNIEQFGYWQLFLFYAGYVGFFHFGLNDGIYLRYGGIEYNQLNRPLLGAQFWLSFLVQLMIALAIILYSWYSAVNGNREFIIICTGIFLFTSNLNNYIGWIFQASNLVRKYSLSVIIQRFSFLISVFILLLFRNNDYHAYILLFLFSSIASLIYSVAIGHRIVFVKLIAFKTTISEFFANMSVGIKLTVSNIASMLILGVGQFVVDRVWGIETFGKYSLSISLTMFFLLFISQVSMVLFPALRQASSQTQRQVYMFSRDFLSIFLSSIFLFYVPLNYLVGLWLPQYQESLRYLILFLPLAAFDGKMQVLTITYLKVFRKEKQLLLINVASLLISTILCLIGAYMLHKVEAVIIAMVVSVAVRGFIAEYYVAKLMQATITKYWIVESVLVIVFVLTTWFLDPLIGFTSYLGIYLVYLFLHKETVEKTFVQFKTIINL